MVNMKLTKEGIMKLEDLGYKTFDELTYTYEMKADEDTVVKKIIDFGELSIRITTQLYHQGVLKQEQFVTLSEDELDAILGELDEE